MMLMRGSPALCMRKIRVLASGVLAIAAKASTSIPTGNTATEKLVRHAKNIGRNHLSIHEITNETAEISKIGFGLKADQVIFEERLQQPLVLGNRHQDVWWRKRNMEEETDLGVHATRAQPRPKRDEMIVLDPDEVVGLQHRRKHLSKPVIDSPVAVDAFLSKEGEIEPIMVNRPQSGVGEAKVILAVIAFRERRRRERQGVELRARRVDFRIVGDDLAIPPKPERASLTQGVENTNPETPLGLTALGVRNAIRYDNEAFHVSKPVWP